MFRRGPRQQPLLEFVGFAQVPLELRLPLDLAVESIVLDRDRCFRGQCLETELDLRGAGRSLSWPVQIQHADRMRVVDRALGIPGQHQRDALDGPNGDLTGSLVVLGDHLVVQVGHELRVAGGEDLLGNLPTGLEGVARQRDLPGPASERELQPARGVGEHDEAPFGPAQGDREVDHHCQQLVEHLGGAQGAEPVEQGGSLAQAADSSGGGACDGVTGLLDQKLEVRMSADPDLVAVTKCVLDHPLVVDERAAARTDVAEDVAIPVLDDLGVPP